MRDGRALPVGEQHLARQPVEFPGGKVAPGNHASRRWSKSGRNLASASRSGTGSSAVQTVSTIALTTYWAALVGDPPAGDHDQPSLDPPCRA